MDAELFLHTPSSDGYSKSLFIRRQWEGPVIPGKGKKYWFDYLLPFQNSEAEEGEYERKHHPWKGFSQNNFNR